MSQGRCVGLDLLVPITAITADATISEIIPHSHGKGFHKISWLGGIEITTMRDNLHATVHETTQPTKDWPPMYTFSWSLVTLNNNDWWVRPIAGRQESTKTLFMVELNFFTRGVHILEKMALTYMLKVDARWSWTQLQYLSLKPTRRTSCWSGGADVVAKKRPRKSRKLPSQWNASERNSLKTEGVNGKLLSHATPL